MLRFLRETNRDKPGTIDDSVSGISLSLSFSPSRMWRREKSSNLFRWFYSVYIFVGSPFYFVSSWLVFSLFFFFYLLYGYGMLQLSRWEPWRHFSSIFCFSPLSFVRRILLRLDPIYSLLNLQTIGHAAGGIEFNSLCSCQGGPRGWWMIGTALEKKQNQRAVKMSNGRNGFVIKDVRKSGWVNQSDVLKSVISSN